MTDQNILIARIKQLSDEEIAALLDTTSIMLKKHSIEVCPDCPYCGSHIIIRFGHKCGKQRFRCKGCMRTFVTTTNTVMSNSHFPAEIWSKVIEDTLRGHAIDYTANRLALYHQTVFNMRHKILMVLSEILEIKDVC